MLLAMKKRSFGFGKWNGVGGKVKEKEDIKAAAVREIKEEIGIIVAEEDLEHFGILSFYFENNLDWDNRTHIFIIHRWEGEPVESDEMRPEWYAHNALPFSEMWADDPNWLPKILAGKKIEGEFFFDNVGREIQKFEVREILA